MLEKHPGLRAMGVRSSAPEAAYGWRAVVLAAALLLPACASLTGARGCHPWPDGGSLQAAVTAHRCVRVSPGDYELHERVLLPGGHDLIGAGVDQTILRANPQAFPIGQGEVVVIHPDHEVSHIADLTLIGSGVPTYGVGYRNYRLTRVRLTQASCAGAGIAGAGVTIIDSVIDRNSHHTPLPGRGLVTCASTPGGVDFGAGIYLNERASYPLIVNTLIADNWGPAVDSFRAVGGTLTASMLRGNAGSSAVGLYESPAWRLVDNDIEHPVDSGPNESHTSCYPSQGAYGAAVWLCRSPETTLIRNRLSGWYAIAGHESPRVTVSDNDAHGVVSIGGSTPPLWVTSPGQMLLPPLPFALVRQATPARWSPDHRGRR